MNYSYNQQLRNIRTEKSLSLKQAAKGIGITTFHLFLIENGYHRPHSKTLEKIEAFYDTKIDFAEYKDYPAPFHVYVDKKPISRKKRLIVSGIISAVSLTLMITGSALFGNSARNKVSYYGETYEQLRMAAVEKGQIGRDFITDLEYHYLDSITPAGTGTISFYATNSILYFNNATFTCNTTLFELLDLGQGRFHYQFGGGLNQNSYICDFNFGSSKAGLFFSCRAVYKGSHITSFEDLKITTTGTADLTDALVLKLFNLQIDKAVASFNHILTSSLNKDADFYHDFLSAREMGRVINFRMQIAGLIMLFPSFIAFFIALSFLLLTLISEFKSFLIPLEEDELNVDHPNPLPKDFAIRFWIPDFIIVWLTRIVSFGAFFLLLFSVVGRLFLTLPSGLTSETFLKIMLIALVLSQYLQQLLMFSSIKKEKALFNEIIRNFVIYLFIATLETTIIGITNLWGYDISNLIYSYVPSNLYLAIILLYLIFLFLFFKPSFVEKKGKFVNTMWRLLSILPLGVLVVASIVGNNYNLFYGVPKNIYLLFWFSNTNITLSVMSVIFLYAFYFMKLIYKHKFGRSNAALFFYGDRFSLYNNALTILIILVVVLIDGLFKNSEAAHYLGLGNNIWILLLIIFVALCKVGPNSIEITRVEEESLSREVI